MEAPPAPFHIGYRPPLDGLRAVAVLLVIGVHYQVPGFAFGFLGVDTFFVLSGFLITSILLEEWQHTERISFSRFYATRALRLFPALWLLLLVLSPFEKPAKIAATLFYSLNWAMCLPLLSR
jgi:peptidoglycan/LPS O-acetylase OafA/YrhL